MFGLDGDDLTMLFAVVGGLNTIIVFLAFVNKPIRAWFVSKFKRPEELQNARIIAIEQHQLKLNTGVRALLADRLHQSCLYFLDQQCISIGDMANVDLMYEEYKGLGGNGLIKNMVMRVRTLKITAGDRCYGSHGNGIVGAAEREDELIDGCGIYETSESLESEKNNY